MDMCILMYLYLCRCRHLHGMFGDCLRSRLVCSGSRHARILVGISGSLAIAAERSELVADRLEEFIGMLGAQ